MWYMYNRLCAISVHFALNKNHLFVRFVNISYSFQPLNKYYKEKASTCTSGSCPPLPIYYNMQP